MDNSRNSLSPTKSIFARLDKDIPSGIVVFLVALPLCLGIALASGAPLVTGLISGVIGGLVVGGISQSGTSVSGPAASLSAVVLVMIQSLGNFETFLMALVIGGLMQLLLGTVRAGLIADYMPTSIIRGLLAAIGIILIFSQIPYALGVELDTRLSDYSQGFILESPGMILYILQSMSPGAILISMISLGLLIYWDKTALKKIPLLPPSLFVVILGVLLNTLFKYFLPVFYLDGVHLVSIPEIAGISSVLTFPDFGAIGQLEVWTSAFTIAIVGSIATLLNLEATDNLDPHKRRSSPNRELVAQGVGNTLAGLVGGIPITSVIVRSSVNIEAGSETKLSTLIHGALLLVSTLFLSTVINMIPLATLAAILLVVGYKLASLTVFRNMYSRGWTQFIPFVITTVAIILTDVLIGVLIGSTLSIFFLLRSNFYNPFYLERSKSHSGESVRLELSNEVSFLNKPVIKKTLWSLPENSKIVIDATFSTYVEPDVIEILNDFQDTFAKENKIEVQITGLKESYDPSNRINLVKEQDSFREELTTPQKILDHLISGNRRYVDGNLVSRRFKNKELTDFISQAPLAAVVNCTDMREPLNMLLNTGIGDLIPLRAPGNLISGQLIQGIEIACRQQQARLILLMGNSGNTFIKEALEHHMLGKESYLAPLIEPALASGAFKSSLDKIEPETIIDEVVLWNLEYSKREIVKMNAYLSREIEQGSVGLCSAFYDRKTGFIKFSELYSTKGSISL